ncbi:MAG: hypothetical protein Q8P02_02020 [Candidatus Micrarchaeota archaeon]|nr:hypothetical protein [Candidatus Micrarchaeota archaeon]
MSRVGGEHRVLGSGKYGTVYYGRIRFGGSSIRVAVKKFNPSGWLSRFHSKPSPLSEREAVAYQKTIDDLRRETGARMPKMGVYQVTEVDSERSQGLLEPGEWVVVSQLHGSSLGGSNIVSLVNDKLNPGGTQRMLGRRIPLELKKSILTQAAVVANAGYYPSGDALAFSRNFRGDAKLLDLDLPALHKLYSNLTPEQEHASVAKALVNHIHALAVSPRQAQTLFNHVLRNLHPVRAAGIRRELLSYRPIEYHLFFHNFFHDHVRVTEALRDKKRLLSFGELLEETGLRPSKLRTALYHLGVYGNLPEPNKTRQGPVQVVRFKDGKYGFVPPHPKWTDFNHYDSGSTHAFA